MVNDAYEKKKSVHNGGNCPVIHRTPQRALSLVAEPDVTRPSINDTNMNNNEYV